MCLTKLSILLPIFCIFSFFGCASANNGFETISAQAAKKIMDTEKNYVIVDVREPSEYREGHIQNAILLPLSTFEKESARVLPDKEQLLLVYCRSGRRSKEAANILVNKGYKKVKDFGGIIDWPYEIVK